MHTALLLIANRDIAASGDAMFERINPLTGEVATRTAAATVADALAAADSLEDRTGDFEAATALEIGATKPWTQFNLHLAAARSNDDKSRPTRLVCFQ
jgi:hypothetical protein